MSALTRILVHVPDNRAHGAIALACRAADRWGGKILGLHASQDPVSMVPLVGEGMSGSMVEQMLSHAQGINESRAQAAHAVFADIVGPRPQSWLAVQGDAGEMLARHGRLTDLIVMGRGRDGDGVGLMDELAGALTDTGRPVLLCGGHVPDRLGRHVAVAWKPSAEAARAIAFARPILRDAETVSLISVDEPVDQDVLAYLADHGITATALAVKHRDFDNSHTGPILLEECRRIGADLLVMGAFSHSRLRQLVLGGVTRHILSHAQIPCLLSH